jgi:hypothetical protein
VFRGNSGAGRSEIALWSITRRRSMGSIEARSRTEVWTKSTGNKLKRSFSIRRQTAK